MKKSLKNILEKASRKPLVTVPIVLVVAIVLACAAIVLRAHIVQSSGTEAAKTIQVTGTVEPADTVTLGFQTGGVVVKVTKVIGDRVSAGEVIAEVENGNLKAELAQAEAAVTVQKAALVNLEAATNTAATDVVAAQVSKDNDAITDDTNDLQAVLAEDYSVADDSIHDKVDDFFVDPYSANPQLAFSDSDPSASTIESGRIEVENRLTDLQMLTVATSTGTISDTSTSVEDDLAEIKLFLDNVALTVNALSPSDSGVSQASIDDWKTDLSTARANIDDSITATLAAANKLQADEDTLTVDEQQLGSDQNAGISTELASQKAAVAQAEALVTKLNTELAKTYIISPIDGLVATQDARLGESAPANTDLVSIESDSKYQIVAIVPETDAGRLMVGESADVRLDDYGPDVVFGAVVVGVSPTETAGGPSTGPASAGGSSTDAAYTGDDETTTLQFEASDDRIKSGMSASIVIHVSGVAGETAASAGAAPASTTVVNNI